MTYDELVMEVYEASANPEYFREVAERICEFARGGRVHLMLIDPVSGRDYLHVLSGEQDDFAREYNDFYLERDFRVPRVLGLPVGRWTDERSYVSAEEARTSDIHRDLLARYRVHNISGTNLRTGSALGWFGISVRELGGEFDEVTKSALSSLGLHMRRAFGTAKANADIRIDGRLMNAALDQAGSAILIVSGDRVVLANAPMNGLLSHGFFRLRGARLGCRDEMGGRRLAALQDCDDPDGCPPVMVRDPRTGESFAVASRCLFPQFQSGGLVMGRERIVTVTSVASTDEPDLVAIGAFCREHDLSPREAEVTTVVLTGGALSRHAIERGVSVDTVRKQLKAAMARLEVANQKAMVLLFERFRSAG